MSGLELEGTKLAIVSIKVEEEIIVVEVANETYKIEALRCKCYLKWREGTRRLPRRRDKYTSAGPGVIC